MSRDRSSGSSVVRKSLDRLSVLCAWHKIPLSLRNPFSSHRTYSPAQKSPRLQRWQNPRSVWGSSYRPKITKSLTRVSGSDSSTTFFTRMTQFSRIWSSFKTSTKTSSLRLKKSPSARTSSTRWSYSVSLSRFLMTRFRSPAWNRLIKVTSHLFIHFRSKTSHQRRMPAVLLYWRHFSKMTRLGSEKLTLCLSGTSRSSSTNRKT